MSKKLTVSPRQLDKRLRVERKTQTKDANGDITTTWATVATVYARIDSEPVLERHKEPLHDKKQQIFHNYEIWVRADVISRFSLIENDRFYWAGKNVYIDILNIQDNTLRGRFTHILAREGATPG